MPGDLLFYHWKKSKRPKNEMDHVATWTGYGAVWPAGDGTNTPDNPGTIDYVSGLPYENIAHFARLNWKGLSRYSNANWWH